MDRSFDNFLVNLFWKSKNLCPLFAVPPPPPQKKKKMVLKTKAAPPKWKAKHMSDWWMMFPTLPLSIQLAVNWPTVKHAGPANHCHTWRFWPHNEWNHGGSLPLPPLTYTGGLFSLHHELFQNFPFLIPRVCSDSSSSVYRCVCTRSALVSPDQTLLTAE